MKRMILSGLLIAALTMSISAQTRIYYYYDAAGNRIQRTTENMARSVQPRTETTADQKEDKSYTELVDYYCPSKYAQVYLYRPDTDSNRIES